jgi:hypothetical protein
MQCPCHDAFHQKASSLFIMLCICPPISSIGRHKNEADTIRSHKIVFFTGHSIKQDALFWYANPSPAGRDWGGGIQQVFSERDIKGGTLSREKNYFLVQGVEPAGN